ncbi:MAG TPA: hypothetical protein VGL40_04565 [Bacillota bacterium]
MKRRTLGLEAIFGLLLVVSLGGILLHHLTGYPYPASPASDFEMNVLNDLYEAFFLIPVGVVSLWAMRKGGPWGPLLVAGVAMNFVYNYAMMAAGRQNLWVFLWIVKIALSGTVVCMVWDRLPGAAGRRRGARVAMAAYLTLVGLVFGKMMWQRLWASASGRAVDMTLRGTGTLDWGEPFLRDPIVFFALVMPIIIAATIGLWRGTDWGGKAASLSNLFSLAIISAILFTGPLKEFLQNGSVSAAMWGMSAIMIVAGLPAAWSAVWLAKKEEVS